MSWYAARCYPCPPSPLSPERGSYGFSQQMLRQVAYDTLSRRDRKMRHLSVAAHLQAVLPGDGEEVADAIARHYLDALAAIPDDPDAAAIRGRAIGALVRAAERAERTGAPALAAASYATAADLTPPTPPDATDRLDIADGRPSPGELWERAARAADASADWATAVEHAGRAHDYYLQHGQARAAARAQAIAGQALRRWGHHAQAGISSPPRWRCCAQISTPTRCTHWKNSRTWRYSPVRRRRTGSAPKR